MKKVYILTHTVYREKIFTCSKEIGIFSNIKNAKNILEKYKNIQGFKKHLGGFEIKEIEIDKIYWENGFDIHEWIYLKNKKYE